MPELLNVLLLAALPGAGVAAGGLLAEGTPQSYRRLSWSLHAAAGMVIDRRDDLRGGHRLFGDGLS